MAVTLNQTTQLITVSDDIVSIQNLLNTIRDWENKQENMDCPQVAEAAGKQVLSETSSVGVTLTLLNWKVSFGDRPSPVVCSITDGNLVAVDETGTPMSPIEASTNVTVMVAQSSSATMIQSAEIDSIKETVEANPAVLAGTHGSGSWEGATIRRGIFK
uniref:Uncharacterized protein n=1 Tax=viral metagenome TaxID=1070528 RepID=A0A6M3L8Y7_9ZZZZ